MKVSCPHCYRMVWLEGADDDTLEAHNTRERGKGDECTAGGRQVLTEECTNCGGYGGTAQCPCEECGAAGVVAVICYGAPWPDDVDHPLNSKPYNDRSDRIIDHEHNHDRDPERDWIDPVTAGRFDVDALSALQRLK